MQAKVGLSFVSIANAKGNVTAENPNFNFSTTQTAAHSAWSSLLGKIGIAGGTSAQQTVFYTALYHSLLHPNVISDSNGQYVGVNGAVHTVDSGHSAEYSNFSGWDIYRTQAQLVRAGRSVGVLRHSAVDGRRLRDRRHVPQVDEEQRRDVRHGR